MDDLLAEIEKLSGSKLKEISDIVDAEIGGLIRSFAETGSVFAKSEKRFGCPPKNASNFLKFLGIVAQDEVRKERESILKCFCKLREMPRDARGMLSVIVDRGRTSKDTSFGKTDRLSIRAEALTSLTENLGNRHRGLFKIIEDSGIASVEEDASPETLTLHHTLPSGLDFFALVRQFTANDSEMVRKLFEDCDFSCLDG